MKEADAIVRRIVEERLRTPPLRVARQGGGRTNHVFAVDHRKGSLIVRLHPHPSKIGTFLKEQWAVARARRAGLPVPHILAVGDRPVPYVILRKTLGEPAERRPDRLPILRDLGRCAAKIHAIGTRGFGGTFDPARRRLAVHTRWDEFLRTEFDLDRRLRILANHAMLPTERLQRIREILEAACARRRRPALNHGDLRLKNVLVDGRGRITAILDWENCTSNLAPEWDLALALHDLTIDEKEAFISGYGISPRALEAMAATVKAFNLVHYSAELERFARQGKKRELELYRVRLHGLLDLYSL